MLKGIDVSNWQNIDFNTLDTDFIIMKSSEGYGFTDPKFYSFQKQARDKGMLIGYYHFCRPDLNNTPEEEAEYFLSVCKPASGEVLCLDFEVPYADKVNWCKKWLDHIYLKTKCKPLIYLNKSTANGSDWSPVVNADYGLWLADYSYDPDSAIPTTPWAVCAFRQYSNRLVVEGVSGPVDANVFYGDLVSFKKYGLAALGSSFDKFMTKWTGKPIDFDGVYPNQCMDLMHFYAYEVLGITDKTVLAMPSAYQVFTQFKWPTYFTKVANTPTGVPSKGDIVLFGQEVGQWGHVCIFVDGDANEFNSFDANWPTGSLPHIQAHNYMGVLGWLKPLLSIENPTEGILEGLQAKIKELEEELKLMRDSRNTWKAKATESGKQLEQVLSDLEACNINKTTLTNLLETEMTTRKSLEAKVLEDVELIERLRLELTKNKPISEYTVKELIGALFKKI